MPFQHFMRHEYTSAVQISCNILSLCSHYLVHIDAVSITPLVKNACKKSNRYSEPELGETLSRPTTLLSSRITVLPSVTLCVVLCLPVRYLSVMSATALSLSPLGLTVRLSSPLVSALSPSPPPSQRTCADSSPALRWRAPDWRRGLSTRWRTVRTLRVSGGRLSQCHACSRSEHRTACLVCQGEGCLCPG